MNDVTQLILRRDACQTAALTRAAALFNLAVCCEQACGGGWQVLSNEELQQLEGCVDGIDGKARDRLLPAQSFHTSLGRGGLPKRTKFFFGARCKHPAAAAAGKLSSAWCLAEGLASSTSPRCITSRVSCNPLDQKTKSKQASASTCIRHCMYTVAPLWLLMISLWPVALG